MRPISDIPKEIRDYIDQRFRDWLNTLISPKLANLNERCFQIERRLENIDINAAEIRVQQKIDELKPILKHIEKLEKDIFVKYGNLESQIALVCRDFLNKPKETYVVDIDDVIKKD